MTQRILRKNFCRIPSGFMTQYLELNHISRTVIAIQSILVYLAFKMIKNRYNGKVMIDVRTQYKLSYLVFEYSNIEYFKSMWYKIPHYLSIGLIGILSILLIIDVSSVMYDKLCFVFFITQSLYIPYSNNYKKSV